MTLSITYKQQRKEFSPDTHQFGSVSALNNDECPIYFQKLVDAFKIEYNHPKIVLLEYPNAKLRELSMNNSEDEDIVLVPLNTDGYFSCKLDRKYELYTGKRVNVQPTLDEEKCHFSNEDIEIAAILSDAVSYEDPILHINKNYSSYKSISTLTKHDCGLTFARNASSPYLLAISKNNTN